VTISKGLGHSSITITADIYAELLPGLGRQAAERAMALVPRARDVTTSCPHPVRAADEMDEDRVDDQVGDGAPSGTRTPNPLIKSQLLCQLS
jgi:hypothetical protein